MPRVTFVKSARKNVPDSGIKKGESYYWWKFRFGAKRVSKTRPKRSQLTQSNFYGTIYDLEDDVIAGAEANSSLVDTRDDVLSQLEELMDECQSSLDNMPESLQQAPTGELLQERIDALGSAISEFGDLELEEFDPTKGSEVEEGQAYEEGKKEGQCKICGESDFHTVDCKLTVEAEQRNDDDQTEDEYWQEKLEEFQGISIEAP